MGEPSFCASFIFAIELGSIATRVADTLIALFFVVLINKIAAYHFLLAVRVRPLSIFHELGMNDSPFCFPLLSPVKIGSLGHEVDGCSMK